MIRSAGFLAALVAGTAAADSPSPDAPWARPADFICPSLGRALTDVEILANIIPMRRDWPTGPGALEDRAAAFIATCPDCVSVHREDNPRNRHRWLSADTILVYLAPYGGAPLQRQIATYHFDRCGQLLRD